MKLFTAIAAACVISTSLFAASPAEAFWGTGEGEPTYDNLLNNNYAINSDEQEKIYDSPGWNVTSVMRGLTRKMKLVGCRNSKCIYFQKVADDPFKSITVRQVNCINNTFTYRKSGFPDYSWSTETLDMREEIIHWAVDPQIIVNSYCR